MVEGVNMINPKIEIIGPANNNNRTEYLIKGKKVSVGNQDRYAFETTANKYLNASDKYNKYKANHSLGTALIGLTNLLLICGITFGGVKGANILVKKYKPDLSKTLKTAAAILGGMVGFIASGQITKYTGVPGRRDIKEAEKQLNTLDVYFV